MWKWFVIWTALSPAEHQKIGPLRTHYYTVRAKAEATAAILRRDTLNITVTIDSTKF